MLTAAAGAGQRLRATAAGPAWRILRHRGPRVYFAGSLICNLGTWLQNTAQVLLTYHLTRSVLAVGVVTAAQYAGTLLVGPWAAVVADRVGGPRALISGLAASGCVAFGLACLQAAGALTAALLAVGALGLGLANAFLLPIQTSLLPRLLPESHSAADAEAAVAMNSVSYNAGRALAPAACVAVVFTAGYTSAFALNGLSFLVFALAVHLARPRPPQPSIQPVRAKDGLRVAAAEPRAWLLLCMIASVTLADDPVLVLGPARAHQLGVSHGWPGYFLAALGAGAVLGSLRPARPRPEESTSHISKRAAFSLLFLGGAMMWFTSCHEPAQALLAAAAAGAGALGAGSAAQALLLRRRPGQEASIVAVWAIAWAGTKPVASLVDGWLANWQGVQRAGAVLAAPAIVIGLLEVLMPKAAKTWLKDRGREWAWHPSAPALSRAAAELALPVAAQAGPLTTSRDGGAPAVAGLGPWLAPASSNDAGSVPEHASVQGPWEVPGIEMSIA